MSKIVFAFLMMSIGVPVFAVTLVKTNVGGGLVLEVPATYVETAKNALTLVHKNIATCKMTFVEYEDPIISRINTLIINKASSGLCQVTWIKDAVWQYTCKVPVLSRKKWVSLFQERLVSSQYFGDFTDGEKEILFDDKTCSTKRQ